MSTRLEAAILARSPVGYWKLDEGSGTQAVDSSGNGRHGTYSGTYTQRGWKGGDGRMYADFGSGAGGRVAISDAVPFSVSAAPGLTVIAMIRPEASELAAATRRFIVSKGDTGAYEWDMAMSRTSAGRLEAIVWDDNGTLLQNEYIDNDLHGDAWNLVAFATPNATKDQRFDLYSNSAAAVTSSTASNTGVGYTNAAADVHIGWRDDDIAGQYWHGGIAHVAIFAGQLAAADLKAIREAAVLDGWYTTLGGLEAWFDADDPATVTDSSGAVTDWLDKSGNGRDADQSTPGSRPTTGASTLGGRNVIDFAGDHLDLSTASEWTWMHDGTEWDAFIVLKPSTTVDPNVLLPIFSDNGIGSLIGAWIVWDDRSGSSADNNIQTAIGNGTGYVLNNKTAVDYCPSTRWALLDVNADPSNGTAADRSSVRVNHRVAEANNSSSNTASGSDAAQAPDIGGSGTGTFSFTGSMAEIVLRSGAMTADDRALLRKALSLKWSLLTEYGQLLADQGATSHWLLDTARADTDTEGDVLGGVDMTMTGGASTAATAPPMEALTAGVSLTIAGTEGYNAGNSYDPDQDWSFSGWFKMPTQASATTHVLFTLCNSNPGANDYVYLIRRDDQSNNLLLQFGSGTGAKYLLSGLAPENDGKWHHVAVTRNYDAVATADTWTIYIDGAQGAQGTRSSIGHGSNYTADSWYLGNRDTLDNGMDGDLAGWAFADGVIWTADQAWYQYAYGMSLHPTSVPVPEAWYDAADEATITDTTGTISAWADKSSNGRDLGSVVNTPRTGDTTRNGRNVVDFDGTEAVYRTGDFMWDLGGCTAFMVFRSTATGVLQDPVSECSSSSTNPNHQFGILATDNLFAGARGDGGSPTTEYSTDSGDDVADSAWHIAMFVDNGSSAVWHRLDGAPTTADNQSAPEAYTRNETLSLDRFCLGGLNRSGGLVAGMTGSLAEVIIYSGVLSDVDIASVEAWLQHRWSGLSSPSPRPSRRHQHLLVR